MTTKFRIVTWNCRRASSQSGVWDYLLELDPDVAILQDYGTLPEQILQQYIHAPNTKPLAVDLAPGKQPARADHACSWCSYGE